MGRELQGCAVLPCQADWSPSRGVFNSDVKSIDQHPTMVRMLLLSTVLVIACCYSTSECQIICMPNSQR